VSVSALVVRPQIAVSTRERGAKAQAARAIPIGRPLRQGPIAQAMMVPYVLVLYLLSTVRADQAGEGHAGVFGTSGTGVSEESAATQAGFSAARQLSVLADFGGGDPTLAANVPNLRSGGSAPPSLAMAILTPTPTQEANDALRWIIKLGHTSATQTTQTTQTPQTPQTTTAKRTEQTAPATTVVEPAAAAATTTTQALSTTAAVATTTEPWIRPSLYCFVVLMTETYELELVKSQYSRRVGIFRCNVYDVLSDNKAGVAPGVETTAVGSLKAPKCWWGSWCNAEAFLKAWTEVIKMNRFNRTEWTVKADPDTVFFPERLRQHVQYVQDDGALGLYFKNWNQQFGFLGPIEVFSRKAIVAFGAGQASCVQRSDPRQSGEDGFVQSCMEFLHIAHRDDFGLLDGSGSLDSCGSSYGTVSFHAFKTESSYMDCVARAGGSVTTRAPPASPPSAQPASASTASTSPVPAGTTDGATASLTTSHPPATTREERHTTGESVDSVDDDVDGGDGGTCCTSGSDANDVCNTCYQNALLGPGQYCSKSKSNCVGCNGAWCGPGFKHPRVEEFIAKSSYHESLRRAAQPAAAQSPLHLGAGIAAASTALLAAALIVVRRVRLQGSGNYVSLAPSTAMPS